MTTTERRYLSSSGGFTRDTRYLSTRITADGRDSCPVGHRCSPPATTLATTSRSDRGVGRRLGDDALRPGAGFRPPGLDGDDGLVVPRRRPLPGPRTPGGVHDAGRRPASLLAG